jgi:uncharacterized membrane protein YidH (DUF202 family)
MDIQNLFKKPMTGSVLTVASGLSFFFTCMLLPLVGRAGASVPYAGKNQAAFLSVVTLTLLLGALAAWSKLLRRADDKSPLPIWSLGLCGICIVLFVLQVTGLLAI